METKSKRQKIFAILQLCLVSTVIVWIMGYPFLGGVFERKEQILLYQYVMGGGDTIERTGVDAEVLQRNAERFAALPPVQKKEILTHYDKLQEAGNEPMLRKLAYGMRLLLLETTPLFRLWMFLAITSALMVLRQRPGAATMNTLTLSAALLFVIFNALFGREAPPRADHALFPSESYLIERYAGGQPAEGISAQHDQLSQIWQKYLSEEWAQGASSEEGEWHFTLARIQKLWQQEPLPDIITWRQRWSLIGLLLFAGWSLLIWWKG